MKTYTAAQRHDATHQIDELAVAIVNLLVKMVEPAYTIGAGVELVAVQEALQALHRRANDAHAVSLREMKN